MIGVLDFETVLVGGIPTARLSRAELAAKMVLDCRSENLCGSKRPIVVFSSNGAVIAAFHRDREFRKLLSEADVIDADGMPLVFASRLLCERPLAERVATTDFIHDASAAAVKHRLSFYFLGGKEGVADKAALNLTRIYPDLNIVGARSGFFRKEDEASICADIVAKGTDVLWLGLGSPTQERFAISNRERLRGVGWIKTCGGLFDHYEGNRPRAPLWMQKSGLEWLFRAMQEPLRLGVRYIRTNPPALFHLMTKTSDGVIGPSANSLIARKSEH